MPKCESVDCLGRTLDWLYAHDLTKLFAGIASRERRIFEIKTEQIYVDTTSFSVSDEYTREMAETPDPEASVIAITYGCSRDHRKDIKQWMVALATAHEGDIPLFMQPLDGTSLDKVRMVAAMTAIQSQLRETDSEDGRDYGFGQMSLPHGDERWVVIYTHVSVERVRQTMLRQVTKAHSTWEHTC